MKKDTPQPIIISPSIIFYTLFVLIVMFGIYYLRSLAILVYLAFILATAIYPSSRKVHLRLKLNWPISILLSLVSVIAIVIFILALLIPPLARQLIQLIGLIDLPIVQQQLRQLNVTSIDQVGTLAGSVGASVGVVAGWVGSAFNGVFSVIALLVLTYYITLEKRNLHQKAYWFTKNEKRVSQIEDLLLSLDRQLGGWVRGQVMLMFVIGLMTYAGLSLLSIPYALPLALLAGLLEIIPNLGPTISAIPSIFIAYITHGPVAAGMVFLMGIVIQQLENSLIVPRVMQKNANVNPLISIVAVLAGFQLAGPVGSLLSIPTYIIFRTIYSSFFRHQINLF